MGPRTQQGGGPVTPERVVEAALRLIDEEGLEALTMRRLAHDLGVEPVTVYRQLPNKEAILAAVAELLWLEVGPAVEEAAALAAGAAASGAGGAAAPRVSASGDWRAVVRAMWLGLFAVMRAHPNAIPVIARGGMFSASAARGTAGMVALLRDAGLTPDEAGELVHILSACVAGFGNALVWGREIAAGGVPERPAGEPPAPPPADLVPYLERLGRWEPGEFSTAVEIVLTAYADR